MSSTPIRHRVALAGTILNRETGDILPGAIISITAAPERFAQQLMMFVSNHFSIYPALEVWCEQLSASSVTTDPFQQAQIMLDGLQTFHRQIFHRPPIRRPDRTVAGGDGHYHFLDLPTGRYHLMVNFETLDHQVGTAYQQVYLAETSSLLNFTQLDIPIWLGEASEARPMSAGSPVSAIPQWATIGSSRL